MNPLDTKLRRNRFSGYAARPGINALASSSWGKKNPGGIPICKLGLVWNSLVNGLRLIEDISEEVDDISEGDIFESINLRLGYLPDEVKDLMLLYSESINGRFADWVGSRTVEDARKIASFLEDVTPSSLSGWLKVTDLTENSSEMKTWFLFEGGKALESSLRNTLRAYDSQ
jgi:hypothetical protein